MFKTSTDYKLNIGANELEPPDRTENIVGMRENSDLPAFPFPPMFSKDFCSRVVKTRESSFNYFQKNDKFWTLPD